MSTTWDELQRSLEQFMTATAARIVLRSAVDACQLSSDRLNAADLPRLITALIPAALHFVDSSQRGKLAAQLQANLKGPSAAKVITVEIRSERDASLARLEARALCQELGSGGFEAQKIATAVSELARNQVSYAGGGTIELSPILGPPRLLRIIAVDRGHGIKGLDEILAGKYRSKTGLGLGILGVKRLADRFDIQTGERGTRVELEVKL